MMPKNKHVLEDGRDENSNGNKHGIESSGNNNGYTNGSGAENHGGLNNSSKINNNGNRRGKADARTSLNLGPYTETAKETIQQLSASCKAIKSLSDAFTKHAQEIEQVSALQQRYSDLQEQCTIKDKKIEQQKSALSELKEMSQEKEAEFADEKARIMNERNALEDERNTFKKLQENTNKRLKVEDALQRSRQEKELVKLKEDQDQLFKYRVEKLDQEMREREEQNKKRLTDLETSNKELSEKLREQEMQIKQQIEKLAKAKEDLDDLKIVRNSLRDDTLKLKEKLKKIENEFALTGQTTEF